MSNKAGLFQVVRNALWNPKHDARGQAFNFSTLEQLSNFMGNTSDTDSGETISERKSNQLDTVFACINTISQDVAKTKSPVKKEVNGINQVVRNQVNYAVNKQANRLMTSFHWKYIMASHVLGWGNGYSGILRHPNGDIELIPLMPWQVTVHDVDGVLYYEYLGHKHHQRDILHFKLFTEDGIIGISPAMWNVKLMGYKIKQDRYSTRAIGVKPPGFVSGDATNEQFEANINNWNNHMSGDDPKGIPYMNGTNVKFNPLMIPPNEGQHLETKQYTDTKICSFYRVPLSKIQFTENIKYSNQEQQDIVYVKDALVPLFEMMEQEMDCKLFKESNKRSAHPFEIKFNVWGNIRADLKTRTDFYRTGRTLGFLSADEIRSQIDMQPIGDNLGEDFYIQGAMMPLKTQKDAMLNSQEGVKEDDENTEEDG